MHSMMSKPDVQMTDSSAWNVWADVEAGLNEMGSGREPGDRMALATRFEWGCTASPKHD